MLRFEEFLWVCFFPWNPTCDVISHQGKGREGKGREARGESQSQALSGTGSSSVLLLLPLRCPEERSGGGGDPVAGQPSPLPTSPPDLVVQ